MQKYTPCRRCGTSPTPGYLFVDGNIEECSCKKMFDKIKSFNSYFISRGFPAKYLDYSEEGYEGNVSRENFEKLLNLSSNFKEIAEVGAQIYIYGDYGCQRTAAAVLFAQYSKCNGAKCYYVTFSDLIETLTKASINKDKDSSDLDSKVTQITNTDILVIDDIFDQTRIFLKEEKGSSMSYKMSLFESLLNKRIRLKKVQVYTSNMSPNSIPATVKKIYTDRVISQVLSDTLTLEFKDVYPKSKVQSNTLSLLKKLAEAKK